MSTDTLALMSGDGALLQSGSALSDSALQDFLEQAADMGAERVRRFDLFEEYYEGDHRVELTDRARTYLEPSHEIDFSENFCELIVDEIATRMIINRITAESSELDDQETLNEIATEVSRWWSTARLAQTADVVHTNTLLFGESFLIVEVDESGEPVFAYNDPRKCRAFYPGDDTTRPAYVSKRWSSTELGPMNPQAREIERLNVYYPDRIEKFFALGRDTTRGWEFWLDEGEQSPIVPVELMPVVHFRNRPRGTAAGRSELASDVPFQDAHNKLVVDLMMILDNQAWQQRYIVGMSSDESQDVRNVPGEIWSIPNENASVGSFPAESPEGVITAIENGLNRRARRARVPMHLLTGGDMPSGEALRAAEAPLVKKVRQRMEIFGNGWEDAITIAMQLGAFDEFASDITLSVQWDDPGTEDPRGELEAAAMKQALGVSKATLMEELGYDPEHEAEKRSEEREQSLGSALMNFDRGIEVDASET